MIDQYDYSIFPNLQYANPIHFKLNKGQSLYIPRKWWHWIKTTQKTFAVNYWFENTKEIDHFPFIFDHSIDCDINLLNNEIVTVWNSEKNYDDHRDYEEKFSDFYNSGKDNAYVVTLNSYPSGSNNFNIKQKFLPFINFPVDERLSFSHMYDYNLWISSNKHDTGLHYDDEDGILTVVEGEKDIILFPPSDSKYLYPYDVEYLWRSTPPTDFRYNTFGKRGNVNGINSGELLYTTCNNDIRVLSNISKLFYKYRDTNLIWGYKKNGNEYRWEIYYYTLNDEIRIRSWDIYPRKHDIGNEEHYYYKIDSKPPELPFWGYGKYKKQNLLYDESKMFVVDTYESFYKNYDDYMDRLGYNHIKLKFQDTILKKYDCYELCIFNKNPNQIFVMYFGLSNNDFLQFLETNKYPTYVIEFVKDSMTSNNYHINNEIAVVYDIDTQEIIRSGFYGNI